MLKIMLLNQYNDVKVKQLKIYAYLI